MLSKSEILITKRFLFSKKSEGYVSIFSWFSIIGIALGVAAIIIVMSVMNGFRANLTERLVGVNSHLNIYSFNKKIKDTRGKKKKAELTAAKKKALEEMRIDIRWQYTKPQRVGLSEIEDAAFAIAETGRALRLH